MTYQRALVVGGLGFLGSNLAEHLIKAGSRVTIVAPSRRKYVETTAHLESLGARIIEGDMRDSTLMAAALEGQTLVFHAAGRSGAVASMEDPMADLDVNCRGTLALVEAMRAVNPAAKLVFVGSRLEYGPTGAHAVPEDHDLDPLCVYAVHKLIAEKYLRLYSRLFGLRYVVARVTNPYGPGQPRARTAYGIVNRMIHLALGNGVLTIYGDGSQRRDYIYIDDVSAALVALAGSSDSDGRAYNVGTGIGTPLGEMAAVISRIAGGGRVETVDWPPLAQQIETGDFVADISRIQREIGWRPQVSLEDGLQRTVAFYRAHVCP